MSISWRGLGYFVAAASVGLALLIRLNPAWWLGEDPPLLLLFTLAIILSSMFGLRQGLLATLLSVLAVAFTFPQPAEDPWPEKRGDLTRLVLLTCIGLIVSCSNEALLSARERMRRRLEELQKSEERLRLAVSAAGMGTFEVDLKTQRATWSPNKFTLLGYAPRPGGEATVDLWRDRVHRDDRIRVEEALQRAGRERSLCSLEHRVIRADDGEERWLKALGRFLHDEQGEAVQFTGVFFDITESKKTAEALEESERRFRGFATHTKDVLWITSASERRLLFVNSSFERVWGRPAAEIYEDISRMSAYAHPEDRECLCTVWKKASQGPTSVEYRIFRTDGSMAWIHDSAFPIRDDCGEVIYIGHIAEDITDRKLSEEALRASEVRLSLAAEAGAIGVWDWDVHRNSLTAAGQLDRLTGVPQQDLEGKLDSFLRALQPLDRIRFQEKVKSCFLEKRESWQDEYRFLRQDGTVVWVDGRARVSYSPQDIPLRMTGVCIDITERKRLERDIERYLRQLKGADRSKDRFLAMLAHELRNPLAPIRGAVEILQRLGPPEPALQDALHVIERQVGNLVRLVDDLLDVSRIARGKMNLKKERLPLVAVVEGAIESSRPLIEARRHRLTVALPPEPLFVEGDMTRLCQVVLNLLNNAAKYTPEGGHLEVRLEQEGGEGVVRVKDDGLGITPEILPRVFDFLCQADRTLERSEGGLGIGLTLVKSLVDLHGGTVTAHSEGTGRGSEFVVRLPLLDRSLHGPEEESPALLAHWDPGPGSDRREALRAILVVDDNRDTAEVLCKLLHLAGYKACMAFDGPSALIAAREQKPDAVLLDIGLPGMDGFEVARLMRQERDLKAPVFIAMTGHAHEEDRERSRAAGFLGHLVKPVQFEALHEMLGRVAVPRSS